MTDTTELIARLQLVLDLLDAEASRLRAENSAALSNTSEGGKDE